MTGFDHLRGIDIGQGATSPPPVEPVPEMRWVPLSCLVLNDRFQRPLTRHNWRMIEKIAAEFQWSRFSPLLCAPIGNDRFSVIDGQHRAHAAALRQIESVPAMIVVASEREQALAFAETNANTVRITPFHVYRAALSAGERWAVTADNIARDAGCRLMTSNSSSATKRSGDIFGVVTFRDLINAGHADVLSRVLRALRAIDHSGRVALYSDFVIRPLAKAMVDLGGLPRLDLLAFLEANDPYKVPDRARRATEAGDPVSARQAFVEALKAFAQAKAA